MPTKVRTTAAPHPRNAHWSMSPIPACGSANPTIFELSPALRRASATSRSVPTATVCSAEPSAPPHRMESAAFSSGVMRPSVLRVSDTNAKGPERGRGGLNIWDGTPLELAWLPRWPPSPYGACPTQLPSLPFPHHLSPLFPSSASSLLPLFPPRFR